MKHLWKLVVCVPFLLGTGACPPVYEEMSKDQVCDEIGYAISNRTLQCTGDEGLALERFDRFEEAFRCRVEDKEREPIEEYFHCPVSIGQMECADVERAGDVLEEYLKASPVCPAVVEYTDGRIVEVE